MLCAASFAASLIAGAPAHAEVPLTDPAKTNGWEVTIGGREDAYLSWVFGHTIDAAGVGNVVNPNDKSAVPDRYQLVGPQIGIQGNPTPSGALGNQVTDTNLSTPRIRGGFASSVLTFNVRKQLTPDIKLSVQQGLWAGIQNALASNFRPYNAAASVDWREQWLQLEGSWGVLWGGRRAGLYNRGGMKMDWYLMHRQGVGQPCDVDSAGAATCGQTGTGSMFPARQAQIGYATPDLEGFQLNIAIADPAMIDATWNRTPMPRFETEATYHKVFTGTDELNIWANGLTQVVGRTAEVPPQGLFPGIPADGTVNVWGVGGGAWARFSGFALGGTGWGGKGLGTAWAFGNTAVDDAGVLRTHFGYLAIANYTSPSGFEIAASYGSANVKETDWDKAPSLCTDDACRMMYPHKVSVIKEVRGIGGKIAYHIDPVVFSIDGMALTYTWWRGEVQKANVISAGLLTEF
jgi:hypothetical protein